MLLVWLLIILILGIGVINVLAKYFINFHKHTALTTCMINSLVITLLIYLDWSNIIQFMGNDYMFDIFGFSLHRNLISLLLNVLFIVIIPISFGFFIKSINQIFSNIDMCFIMIILFPVFHKVLINPICDYIIIYCLLSGYVSMCGFMLYKIIYTTSNFSLSEAAFLFIRSFVLILIAKTVGVNLLYVVLDNLSFLLEFCLRFSKLSVEDSLQINLSARFGQSRDVYGQSRDIFHLNPVGMNPLDWTHICNRMESVVIAHFNDIHDRSDFTQGLRVDVRTAMQLINANSEQRNAVRNYFVQYQGCTAENFGNKTIYNQEIGSTIINHMKMVNSLP